MALTLHCLNIKSTPVFALDLLHICSMHDVYDDFKMLTCKLVLYDLNYYQDYFCVSMTTFVNVFCLLFILLPIS